MSLYNLIHGVNQATFYFLPMLGKHPEEYPRFRDCYLIRELEEFRIVLLLRVGGGNREDYAEQIEEIRKMSGYVRDWDWDEDNTYAEFEFEIPEKWKADVDKIIKQDKNISDEYFAELIRVYPKLEEKFKNLFGR